MSTAAPGKPAFDVREHGASGDGRANDTAALQRAVDACHRAGGGVAYCPPGDYLTGTVQLKSNVNLHLEAGARLLASTQKSHYDSSNKLPNGHYKHPHLCPEHLIWARDAENVSITGRGTIDGRGNLFFGEQIPGLWHLSHPGWRPDRLIAFIECRDVLMEGVTFRDAPGWTIWPLGCDRVRITGINILNNRWGPNTDGIDPDCCRDVIISDCYLDCGDDCIALKSSADLLGEPRPCEDVVVTGCTLRSTTCAIRIGYEGDGPIRNCSFSNLIMRESRTGIGMQVPRHAEIGIEHGPAIENLSFSNVIMDAHLPFFLWTGDDASPPGGIRDIRFSGIRATAGRGSYFGGSRAIPLEGILLRDVEVVVGGEMDDEFGEEVPYPYRVWGYLTRSGPNARRGIPHALYFRHARDVSLRDVRVRWGKFPGEPCSATLGESSRRILGPVPGTLSGLWRSALRCEQVENLDVDRLVARGAPGPAGAPAVHLTDVEGTFLRGCRAAPGTGVFLRADGAGGGRLTALGNDLAAAERAFDFAGVFARGDAFGEAGNRLP